MRTTFLRPQKGFTLVELLIVVAIIAIISAIAVPNFIKILDQARDKKVMSNMRNIGVTLGTYQVDQGYLPTPDDISGLLAVLRTYDTREPRPLAETDAWGGELYYRRVSDFEYTLRSFGKDRTPGNLATEEYFDANADTILMNGVFVASHGGATRVAY